MKESGEENINSAIENVEETLNVNLKILSKLVLVNLASMEILSSNAMFHQSMHYSVLKMAIRTFEKAKGSLNCSQST